MHSKMFRSVLLSTLVISLLSLPMHVRADETVGIPEIQENYIRLVTQLDTLDSLIVEIRADKSLSTRERGIKITQLQNQRSAIAKEASTEKWRMKRSQKNFEKAEKKQGQVEELEDQINKLSDQVTAAIGNDERVKEIQTEISKLNDQLKAKRAAVNRREKRYEKRVGEPMPAVGRKAKAAKIAEEVTAAIQPIDENMRAALKANTSQMGQSSGHSEATDREKKKLPECWPASEKQTKTSVFAHFPIGKSELEKAGSGPEEEKLRALFDQTVMASLDDVRNQGNERIAMIEAVGYASTIPMRSKSNDQLSKDRAQFAVNNFFSTAMIDADAPGLQAPGYTTWVTESSDAVGGPKWNPREYSSLKKNTAVTESDLRKAAEAVLASAEFTPVKVEGDVDATIAKIKLCCSANHATLKYQPYQFMELKIFGTKFTPESPECIARSKEIADAKEKPVDLIPVQMTDRPSTPNYVPAVNGTGNRDGSNSGDAGH